MPVGWDRIAAEKNALVSLSEVDPQEAMDLFYSVENPQPLPAILAFPEDVRADAAAHIFPNYWRFAGLKGLSRIRAMADHIGNTGEYPYGAMALIIRDLAKSSRDANAVFAKTIFRQAVKHYRRPSKFLNRNEEFFEMLEAAEFVVNRTEYEQALRLFVTRLVTHESKGGHYIAKVVTSNAVIEFRDENESLLFKSFPLIADTDPKWAELLVQTSPVLAYARASVIFEVAGVIRGDPPDIQLTELQEHALRLALKHSFDRLQDSDPQLALALSNQLSNHLSLLPARSSLHKRTK